MGSIAKLIVAIGADMSEFNKQMGKVQKSVEATADKLKKVGSTLTASVTAPILGLAAAATVAFDKQNKAEQRLIATIKANGKEVDSTFKAYRTFASELQNITVVGDEVTLELIQMAEVMASKAPAEAAKNAIAMASALGISEKASIRMVVAAQAGDYTLMNRYVPALRTATSEQEKATIVQKLYTAGLEAAKAEALIGLGPLKQLKNSFGDLLEQFVESVIDGVKPFIQALSGLVAKLQELSPSTKKVIVILSLLAASIGPALLAIGGLAPAFTRAFAIIVPATQRAMASISASISSTGVGALVVALGIAVALIIANWDELKAYFISGGGSKIWEQVQADFNKAWEGIKQASTIIVGVIEGIFSGLGVSLKINFEMFTGIILNIWTAWKTGMLNNIRSLVELVLLNVLRMVNTIKNIIGLVKAIAAGDWAGAWELMKDIVQDQIGFMLGMLQILVGHVLGIAETIASLFGSTVGGAVSDAKKAVEEFGDSIQDAIGSKTVKQVQQISDDIFDVDMSLQDATDSVEEFGNEGANALDKVAGAVGAVSERVKDLVKEMKPISRDIEMGIGIQGGDRVKPAAIEGQGSGPGLGTQVSAAAQNTIPSAAAAASAGFGMAAQAASEFAKVITSRMEHFGGSFDAAMAGDPIGVVVSIFSEFADASTVFTGFMDRLNESLGTVITDLMPLFDGLFTQMEPLIPVITQMATTMSEFAFKTIARLLPPFMDLVGIAMLLLDIFMIWMDPLTMMAAMIAELVVQILIPLLPIFEMIVRLAVLQLAPAFVVLVVAMKILVPIITLLAQGLEILLDAIMSVANKLIDLVNKFGGSMGFGELSIPALAAGGVVNGPTIAMIGEAGPEAVVPLDRLGGLMSGMNSLTTSITGDEISLVVGRSERQNSFERG